MTSLVIGASGLLGRALHHHLAPSGALGTCHDRPRPGLIPLDVRDPDAVTGLLRQIRPTAVINAVGERRPAVWEADPAATHVLNVGAAATIAAAASEVGASLIHISTDYVFDGTAPLYTPDDPPCPVNDYGRGKLAAESAVFARAPMAAILRVPVLYGPVADPSETMVTEIAHALAHREPLTLDHTTRRFPTHVDDVAVICGLLLDHAGSDGWPDGIWHFSSEDGHTKYEIAHLIAAAHQLSTDQLAPSRTPPRGRPGDCHLNSSAILRLLGQYPDRTALPAGSFAERAAVLTHPWITAQPLYHRLPAPPLPEGC